MFQNSNSPLISNLVNEYESKYSFLLKNNIISKSEFEEVKSIYVFKKLAIHYIPSVLSQTPFLSKLNFDL